MPTTNMALVLPTNHDSDDVWDTILEDVFTLIDEHDHTTGKGVKIPSAALKIDADVPWAFGGTNYAITSLAALDFAAVTAASVSGYAGALFVNSSDSNNLYFRTISGTNVKITDGTTLNVSIVGGIGGDYSSVSALLDYDDASDTYRFRQETGAGVRQYAKLHGADLILTEYKAAGVSPVPAYAVTIRSPAALAAAYTVTLPAAVPASDALLVMDSTGAVTANTYTGQPLVIGAAEWQRANGAFAGTTPFFAYDSGYNLGFGNTARIVAPVRLIAGDTITDCKLWLTKGSDNTVTVFAALYKIAYSDGTRTAIDSNSISTNAPGATSIQVASGGPGSLSEVVVDTHYYVVEVYHSAGATGPDDYIRAVVVTYNKGI